jgi:hypothetical protein
MNHKSMTVSDWQKRKRLLQQQLIRLMGGFPKKRTSLIRGLAETMVARANQRLSTRRSSMYGTR